VDVFEAILGRRSIRKFKKEPVSDELIHKIVEAGMWAPSAGNIQSWEVVVVRDDKIKTELSAAAYLRDFVSEAPVIMVLCANKERSGSIYGDRGKDLYCIQDTACATENMLLAAHALGLGACWVGTFDEAVAHDVLNLPDFLRPVAVVPVGFPDEKPYPPTRREIGELMHWEKFSKK